jgi:murein DD-endopeptidase MepM/ murein hydrolase activator NlpD
VRRGPTAAVVAVAVITLAASSCTEDRTARPIEAATRVDVAALEPVMEPVRTTVASGDTIESVCRRLARDEWTVWRDALLVELDPRSLRPGTTFEGMRRTDGRLDELQVHLDLRTRLYLESTSEGIVIERRQRPVERELLRIEGEITSSLFAAVEAAGGDPELAVRMAEIFQWDVDFLRDIRTGDRFVAVVDRESIDGAPYGYGTLFAVRFVNDGRVLDALVYPDDDGTLGYYDAEGRPLRKQFLRSPLKFSRITSRFSMNRFHPVHKKRMPHYGVDYGAPVGTPVQVTSDGTVTFVGRNGGAGKMVRVRHPNGYETSYLHLSGYAQGIRSGVRVRQGQVVGYVGSTGWSTGPHLDYRVKLNGRWINPLGITSPPVVPLRENRLRRFLNHALGVLHLLEGREPPEGAAC